MDTSENVLACFVFGIAKSSFPYTISIRFQSPEYLVFDDLLANSSCHINAIPTSVHIPDWRYLLTNPQEGLRILRNLVKYAQKVVKEQFLAHQSWRKKYLKDAAIRPNEFLDLAMVGMNYPPSQFQLHLQYVTFPVVPFQYYMHTFGKVFMKGRFFPVAYIMRVLELGEPMEIHEVRASLDACCSVAVVVLSFGLCQHTRIETIIDKFDKLGVSYEDMFQEVHDKVSVAQERLGNWKEEEFQCRLSEGRLFKNGSKPLVKVDGDFKKVLQQDKFVLQNYGRPYGENRRPGGTYYKFARSTPMARLKPVTNL